MIGDFHTHMNGNGIGNRWANVKLICHYATELNYDTVFLGCHDFICPEYLIKKAEEEYGLNIIKGAEITTSVGHLLALNIEYIPEDCWANNKNPLNIFKAIEFIKHQKGKAVLAHPFGDTYTVIDKLGNKTELYDALKLIDGVEIASYRTLLSNKLEQFPYIPEYNGLTLFKNSDIHPWEKGSIMHRDYYTELDQDWFRKGER
ncbi:hypothetical protein LCGC14_0951180 [marine sediment metagenome]|uniref:PHP domain-containing protein n=1 Tax=marine sediment metagenome TaxID=412755 RepID=A0A0F9RNP7_9ZZZZ